MMTCHSERNIREINACPGDLLALQAGLLTQLHWPMSQAVDEVGFQAGAVHPARESGWIAWWPGAGDQKALARFTRQEYRHGFRCPLGASGDLLRVLEEWWHYQSPEIEMAGFVGGTIVRKSESEGYRFHPNSDFNPADHGIWARRSAEMPLWASRYVLEIVSVGVGLHEGEWMWVIGVQQNQ